MATTGLRRSEVCALRLTDITPLMEAALSLPPVGSITPHTFRYIIGLMATTGLRRSEVCALRLTDITPRANYRQRVRRELFEWPPEDCIPGSPWTGDSWRFGNRLRRTFGCGSIRRLSA